MAIDPVAKVILAVSEDADHPVRTAVKGTEDSINRLIVDINKALTQLEDLIVARTLPPGEP